MTWPMPRRIPKAAATVVNALLDEYFRLRGEQDAGRNEQVIKALEQERDRRNREVTQKRDAVRELARQVTGKDPYAGAAESTIVIDYPLAHLQNQLAKAEVEREVLKARIKACQDAQERPISDAMIENKIDMHSEVLQVKREIVDLQMELKSLESYAKRGDKDPVYQQISQQIQKSQQFLTLLRKDLQKRLRVELQSAAAAKRDEQIAALQAELDSQQITADMLRKQYDSQIADVKQTSGDTLQLRFKQGELDRIEKVYAMISERIVELRTSPRAERVIVIQRALVPTAPIEVFPFRSLLLAALGGFSLPFALALGSEKLIRRAGDATNLENVSQLPVVGEIAQLPSRQTMANRRSRLRVAGEIARIPPHRRGAAHRNAAPIGLDLRMFQESIDALRTTLMLAEDLRDVRILAVTSAATHEGKDQRGHAVGGELGDHQNKPTLLIDGDMRSPNLHDIFEVPLQPGLTEILEGIASFEDAIVSTAYSHLDLLPAGKLASNPHRLLGNVEPTALIQSIPEKYAYVIIDSPPVLAASESLVLAAMADASLVCVLRDVSRIDQIKRAYQRLLNAGAKPVGLVLNGVPTKSYAYHYGAYGDGGW